MATETEEDIREGQFQEHRYLVPTHPPATVQGYREEAASLQTQIEAPIRPPHPIDFAIPLSIYSFSKI